VPENKKVKTEQMGIIDRIWGFFTSLRLVIVLLLVLSLLSVAGTIIEQNKPLQEYYRLFRPETVELFLKLGLLDMYHSWWFTSCLALLALNVLACTMERYPSIMKGLRTANVVLDEKIGAGFKDPARIKYHLPEETVEKRVTALVKSLFPAGPIVTVTQDAKHFFYEKGKYTRLAFLLTHLSILIIFIGAIVGSIFGFKGYVNINEGSTITSIQTRQGENRALNFGVRCNSFNADYYETGAPKDYVSDLSVIRDGKEVVRQTIRVNDPLTYEGITFYQSSFGALPDNVTFEIRGKNDASQSTVVAPVGKQVEIPGSGVLIEVADYRDHFHFPDGSEAGTAVGVNIFKPGAEPEGVWIYAEHPERNTHFGYAFEVKGIKVRKYTGLQVNKDPGVWVVWTGCIMMVVGIMMAFFTSHRKLWIRIGKDRKGRVELTAGGMANKNKYAFSSELARLFDRFREVS
jgi:cytochrome c biogenesis protein